MPAAANGFIIGESQGFRTGSPEKAGDMRTMEYRRVAGWIAALCVSLAALGRAEAQANFVVEKPRYTLTFSTQWDSVAPPAGQDLGANTAVLAKLDGLGGVSMATCEPGTGSPDIDSVAATYSRLLGGNVEKGSAGSKTLGKYSVNWQDFNYDSLPVLSGIAKEQYGVTLSGKGTFRVYYLVSDGYLFTIAGLKLIAAGLSPNADIETAISGLKLKPQSQAVRPTARRHAGGIWSRDGVLSGEWLQAHPAVSVDCFSLSGGFVGVARPDGSAAWILPSRTESLVVVVRARDGQSLSLLVQQP